MGKAERLRVCVAGVTGHVGRLVAREIIDAPDLELTAAVARRAAGRTIGDELDVKHPTRIAANLKEALSADACDVLVDFTSARMALDHARQAIARKVHVVVGSSGITAEDFAALDAEARAENVGVFHGNFAITAVLAQVFATIAARYVPSWEVIEYAQANKIDAVSATARELAHRLAAGASPPWAFDPDAFVGDTRSRGANVEGTQVHAIRLPGFAFGFETIFGAPHERLTIRHEALSLGEPYVAGTLLAIRRTPSLVGVHLGLERIMDLDLSTT